MSDFKDCENNIFSGPLTIEELRKASKLIRQKRANGNLSSGLKTTTESVSKNTLEELHKAIQKPLIEHEQECNIQCQSNNDVIEEHLEALPPSPREKDEVTYMATEQVIIQEFSLEEANFSGCNLSGLNLSFESGISDPLAVEPTISKHYIGVSEVVAVMPSEVNSEKVENVPAGLYTLACISDLAEKLTIGESEAANAINTTLDTTSELLKTPIECRNNSISRHYSPISPADLSSQYLDAIDESVLLKSQDISKLPAGEVIEAIVSLQNRLHDKMDFEAKSILEASKALDSAQSLVNEKEEEEVLKSNIHQEDENAAVEVVSKEDSILQEDPLCNEEEVKDVSLSLLSSEDSMRNDDLSHHSSLMNDTIDEMDMILSMGVSYLESRDQNSPQIQSYKSVEKLNQPEILSPLEQAPASSKKYFCTPQMKPSHSLMDSQKSGYKIESNMHSKTPLSSSKMTPAVDRVPLSQKKYFPSPAVFKTPVHAKTSSEGKCASVGSLGKTDAARPVHVSTPFRVPKSAEPRSADFKHPSSSRLPKVPHNINVAHITSPVSQYIRGPVIAPRIAVVHSKSPMNLPQRQPGNGKTFDSKMPVPKSRQENKAEIENSNPNVPAVHLPYVSYDSGSAIKVVEHKESKMKPLPNKIKKLMPSPGSVMRHTGRVNIPECVDGRQEVSILVTHDAFN